MTKSCNCQKTGVLHDHLVILNHIKEGNDQLIILDGNDSIQVLLDIWENMGSRSLNCSTVCNGIYVRKGYNLALFQGSFHAGCSGWLNTDNFNVRIEQLGKCGNTCCKSASTDWYQDIVYKRKLLNDLHCDGSLTGCNSRIIKRMDEGIAFFLCQVQCISTGFIVNITVKDYLCAVSFGALYFNKRCGGRHYDHCFHTIFMCGIGNTLCMVSCGSCNQPFASLLIGKSTDLVISSAHLVCACSLHVLRFKKYLVSGQFREIAAFHQLGLLGYLLNNFCRFFKTL